MNVLVTGGTKGIGLAVAAAFSTAGAQVFLNYHADESAAAAAAESVRALGAVPHLLKIDAGTPEGCRQIAARVTDVVQRLDLVVHCAVDAYVSSALAAEPHRLAQAVATNGLSLHFLVQAVLPLLDRGSTVIFLSSRGGREVVPNYVSIGISKALAESLVRYLAVELAPRGIRINVVAPAIVETAAVTAIFGERAADLVREAAAHNPSGRGIRDADYTNLIRWLASPEAEFVQGQVIFVNGGANLRA